MTSSSSPAAAVRTKVPLLRHLRTNTTLIDQTLILSVRKSHAFLHEDVHLLDVGGASRQLSEPTLTVGHIHGIEWRDNHARKVP